MRDLVKIFKALSDPNRLRILKMLEIRPLAVCEITAVLGLATSTVSKHLYLLREAGFVVDEKDGKWVNYALAGDRNTYLRELMPLVERWLEDQEIVRKDREKLLHVDRYQICGTKTVVADTLEKMSK